MNEVKYFFRSSNFLIPVVLILVTGLAYLPFVGQFGYFNDDWYLMYAAGAKGAAVFREIFSIDRPGRALVMMPAFWLFGQDPLYYNLSAYFFRLISGIGLYSLLHMLWPRQRVASARMALLFLIYPGFLSQPNAIDYQSHIVGLAAAMLSIALTVKAVLSERLSNKLVFFSLAILSGWFYLWQMEWYIGFEFFRWASIFVLISRTGGTIIRKITRTICHAYVLILVPAVFLFWRIVLFKPERSATDIGLQLDQVIQSPLTTGLRWLVTLFTDTVDVVVLAWGQPLSSLISWIWTRDLLLLGLGVSAVSAAIVLVAQQKVEGPEKSADENWKLEAFGLGLSSVIAGLFPIILVNRYVDFTFYSRYTLASSAGAAVLLVSLIYSLKQVGLQKVIIVTLVFSATLTHFSNSQRAVQITQATRDFWWQVSWRIPQLDRNTTLVANYAIGATEEDYFVWGPANLIYYPEGTNDKYVQPGVYAALLNQNTVNKALLHEGQEFDNRRTIRTYKNYRRLLVLSQPAENSCVQVIDGRQPGFSRYENASIRVVGQYSDLENVLTNEPASIPPAIVFGPEPEHDWCYFYQQASLARQVEAWDEIQALGEQVLNRNLKPGDPIEWMPFLQAYAQQGDIEHLEELAPTVVSDPYVALQACRILGGLQGVKQEVVDVIDLQYCIK
jgi:hypothetical protein